jgi:sigma-B regulation protein RsbU (phosphoserine phosphatase)
MSTVDWDIQSMVDRLSAIRPTANSFVLLASPKDDYVISNTRAEGFAQTGASLETVPWRGALRFGGDGAVGMGRFVDDGAEYLSFSRMFGNGWLFSVQIPAGEIFYVIETRNDQFTAIIAASFILLLAATMLLLSRLINRPLRKLTGGVAELGGGNLDRKIELTSRDEFGQLAAAFNKMTEDLKASIEQSARELAEKERIGAELNVARKIQASMLPCIFPPFPDRTEFDIFASMLPAREVGGDFYDFFLIDDNTLAVVMADVSGKGVPAALFMVIAKTLIQNTALSGKRPEAVFGIVNKMLCENNEASMFVTAFLGYLDLPSGKFTFVNAGHNPPLLGKVGEPFTWLRTRPGAVLAGDGDTFYRQHEIALNPGDKLFLYTDGITEAVNNDNVLFSDPRLRDTANRCRDLPLREFTVSIKREIDVFAGGAEQADDITMLMLRYDGMEDGAKA